VSLHPSGHLPGASQVRVEYKGEVWVASGDYKTEDDGLSAGFEPVKCHTFITESTFGLPVFRWKPQEETGSDILKWWKRNQENGHASILFAYSLGKAQRLIHMLHDKGIVAVHKTIFDTNAALRADGVTLPDVPSMEKLTPEQWKKALIISPNLNGIPETVTCRTANCSGWMALSRFRSRGNADAGFVLSDHADWPGLLSAIAGTEAENIIVNHGYTAALSRYLTEKGWNATAAPNHSKITELEIVTERG
jgi:putative mRNA 3-end processing factor